MTPVVASLATTIARGALTGFAQELDYVWDAVPRDVKLQTLMFCATLPRRMLETVVFVAKFHSIYIPQYDCT